jgi:SAM-dependent methyltransferase
MVDWGAGSYERTAAELAPVAAAVVERAAVSPGEDVADLACGTGNAALLAAGRGAQVIAVDSAPRLLAVAGERAREQGVLLDCREGDLLALPIDAAVVDTVLSIFGIIFAQDPRQALREVARVLRPGGRALISAWIPSGPIDAMLGAMGRIVVRATRATPPRRLVWSDPGVVAPLAADAGLALEATTPAALAIRAASPEGHIDSADHSAGRSRGRVARGDGRRPARRQRGPGRLPGPQPVRRA